VNIREEYNIETGFSAKSRFAKSYFTDMYVEWLEKRINALLVYQMYKAVEDKAKEDAARVSTDEGTFQVQATIEHPTEAGTTQTDLPAENL
jgi:hypothetical protein